MVDSTKRTEPVHQPDSTPNSQRRRQGQVVHDDKGNAKVQSHDTPGDNEPAALEIEGARQAPPPVKRTLKTGALTLATEDTHDPYTRVPDAARKSEATARTDLRKLSAWIKLMRELEEKKLSGESDED